MCWSPAASLALGAAGLGVAGYAHQEGAAKHFTLPLAYFSLMEFIQYFSYASINQCALDSNTWLTFASYLHIAFQPIVFNIMLMATVPRIPERIRQIAYGISVAVTVILLLKLVPFAPASLCAPGDTLCGPQMCTISGSWHLAWQIPYYDWPFPGDIFLYYAFAVFIVPLFYRAWISVAMVFLTGPALAYLLTRGNPNEWPAIWCFFSVGLMLVATTTWSKTVMKNVRDYFEPKRAARTVRKKAPAKKYDSA